MKKGPTVNYLNNKDILKEIHKSKLSFCFLEDKKYGQQDVILNDVNDITKEYTLEHEVAYEFIPGTEEIMVDEDGNKMVLSPAWTETRSYIQDAKEAQAKRFKDAGYATAMLTHDRTDYKNKPKQKEFYVDPESIPVTDLVFRVMTFEHIPLEPGRKKNPKNESETKAKVNFPPFKHYAFDEDTGEIREVARSHWKGSLEDGHFCVDHGMLTNKLGTMFLKLVDKYSHRANWRGYTYVDEMRGQALVQLAYISLQFNEDKSDNPFAYYTAVITNSFRKVLLLEKKNQGIRDDILIEQGHLPSYTRQLKHEDEVRSMREAAEELDNNQ